MHAFQTSEALRGLGADWDARRQCHDTLVKRPSLECGCPCRFPCLIFPFPPLFSPLRQRHTLASQKKYTPLHLAAWNGRNAVCRALIAAGANVNA